MNKKLLVLLLCLLGLIMFVACTEEKTVEFGDVNLEKAVRENMDKPKGKITEKDVLKIEKLDASDKDIVDLEGIENLTNLKWLDMSGNKVKRLDGLENLTNMEELVLSNNKIVSIKPLKNLKGLRSLDLSINRIKDITALERITKLRVLLLDSNVISDIEPLQELESLVKVDISNNKISDFDSIHKLGEIEDLDYSNNLLDENSEISTTKKESISDVNSNEGATTKTTQQAASTEAVNAEEESGELNSQESDSIQASTSANVESDYIIPYSNQRKLTYDDIKYISKQKLPYARNEIYARHGYIFKLTEYKNYFDSKSWYVKNSSFNENDLSEIEKYNGKLIKQYED